MSKLLFVQKEIVPIGIETISSMLAQAGHETRLIYYDDPYSNTSFSLGNSQRLYERFKNFLTDAVEREKPDIVGFSTFTTDYHWALDVAAFIKKRFALPVIFGGCHVTMVPEEVIEEPAVDMVCIGEGEHAAVALLDAIRDRKSFDAVPNLWFKHNGVVVRNPLAPLITDLDALPLPDKQIARTVAGNSYVLMGSRGCPYRCTYCSNNVYAKLYRDWGKVRFRSVESILHELEVYLRQYPGQVKRIEIMDDVVAVNNTRLRELCEGIKQRTGLPYSCFLHPNLVNEESIQILRATGCYWLKIGVQSASEDNRRKHLLRPEKNSQIRAVAEWCHRHGLDFSFDHIFSLPCDTEQDLIDSVTFYNETRPRIINYIGLVYLPKTRIVDDAVAKGLLTEADVKNINQGQHVTAMASNVARSQGTTENDRRMRVLMGRVAYLYSLISFRSQATVARLIASGFLKDPAPLSPLKIVVAKFIAKFTANQFYIYLSVIGRLLNAPFRRKFFLSANAGQRA